jgi:hypothetical protein
MLHNTSPYLFENIIKYIRNHFKVFFILKIYQKNNIKAKTKLIFFKNIIKTPYQTPHRIPVF